VIAGCCPSLYASIRKPERTLVPRTRTNQLHRRQISSRSYRKQATATDSYVSLHDINAAPVHSRGHSRITSINGNIVGMSPAVQRPRSSKRNAPLPPPPSHQQRHYRNISKNGSRSAPSPIEFWNDVDEAIDEHTEMRLPSTVAPSTRATPRISPQISRRSSKGSMKYTPIQIPGTAAHRQDRSGSLSGAFWSEMSDEERKEMDERAKEIRIQYRDSRTFRDSEDAGARGLLNV
jgi:hypothetical protein